MPPRAVIPCLTGSGLVLLLSFVRYRTRVFGMTLVQRLRAKQAQLGGGITDFMIDAHLSHFLAIFLHVDDEAANDPTRTACLVVDGLDCGGYDLEVVIRFQGFVHLCLVPQLLEKSCKDAKIGRNLRKHLVGRAFTHGDSEESVCSHDRASCHGLCPSGVLDRLAQVEWRKNPGRLLQDADPVLPHLELL